MKKLLTLCLLSLLLLALLSGCVSNNTAPTPQTPVPTPQNQAPSTGSPAPVEKKSFQLGHVLVETEDSFYQYFGVEFAKRVNEYSGGAIEIDVIGNSQLGGERDIVEGMQLGSIDMAIVGNFILGSFEPKCMIFDLPYIFTSYDMAKKVVDSEAVKIVDKAMAEKGLILLSRGQGGFRHVINSVRPIREVSDMNGLKIRVPENPLYMDTFKALGANATPMAWTEVFTGLQQKTVDGAENAVQSILNERFYEAASYISATSHFFNPAALIVSDKLWQKFSEEEKEILMRAAKEAAEIQWQFVVDREQDIFKELESLGAVVNQDVNLEAFRNAALPVYDNFKDQIGADLVDMVLELTK